MHNWLLGRETMLGINRVVVPYVDTSRIEIEAKVDEGTGSLQKMLPMAARTGIEFHLETSLVPGMSALLLDRLPPPLLKTNYDSGNSLSLAIPRGTSLPPTANGWAMCTSRIGCAREAWRHLETLKGN